MNIRDVKIKDELSREINNIFTEFDDGIILLGNERDEFAIKYSEQYDFNRKIMIAYNKFLMSLNTQLLPKIVNDEKLFNIYNKCFEQLHTELYENI